MVFGLALLSVLWLALTLGTRDPMVQAARSTVLWFYGTLALAAMILRVLMEAPRPLDVIWYRTAMDYAGPSSRNAQGACTLSVNDQGSLTGLDRRCW